MNRHPGFIPIKSPKTNDQLDEDIVPNSSIAESLKRRRRKIAQKRGAMSPDVLDELGKPTGEDQNAGN